MQSRQTNLGANHMTKQLFTCKDARNMARTMLKLEHNANLRSQVPGASRLPKVPANIIATLAMMPQSRRTARVDRVTSNGVVLRIGTQV